MDKENEIKIGEATYTVERQFSGKKTLKELLVEHIVSVNLLKSQVLIQRKVIGRKRV